MHWENSHGSGSQLVYSSSASTWNFSAGITVSFCPHQKNKVELFYKLRLIMMELIDLRRQLLAGHLTQDQSRDIKRHITVRLDWGNE